MPKHLDREQINKEFILKVPSKYYYPCEGVHLLYDLFYRSTITLESKGKCCLRKTLSFESQGIHSEFCYN